jgi:hypothetical protein
VGRINRSVSYGWKSSAYSLQRLVSTEKHETGEFDIQIRSSGFFSVGTLADHLSAARTAVAILEPHGVGKANTGDIGDGG